MARDLTGVLDAVLAGVVVLDVEGRVELLNAAACRLLETSPEAARGTSVERLCASPSLAKLARGVLDSGRSAAESDHEIERRFERALVVDVALSPLHDDAGNRSGVVLVLRDRTLQKTLDQFASERETLATLGHMATGIAHEVRNPLGGIRGAAEIVSSRTEDPKTRQAAELIVREVDRIAGLVDDLMVFTRNEELRLSEVNIHYLLDQVIELLDADPLSDGIEVTRLFDPSLPVFLADADRLAQVFLNLARNAVQAMQSDGGTLTIRTRAAMDQWVSAGSDTGAPMLIVELEDTGHGVDADQIGQLGTPFFTTRPHGTGMGLALSRYWVSRHDGSLRIDSRPGEGTSVQITLPLRMPS